jgi:hypothetical protein
MVMEQPLTDLASKRGGGGSLLLRIKRFVGRLKTIDQIFRWLKLSDEPRTFLYGKGGSGLISDEGDLLSTLQVQASPGAKASRNQPQRLTARR